MLVVIQTTIRILILLKRLSSFLSLACSPGSDEQLVPLSVQQTFLPTPLPEGQQLGKSTISLYEKYSGKVQNSRIELVLKWE